MSGSRGFWILSVVAFSAWSLPAAAQVRGPIDHRVDGRALDASNQLGAGGYNASQNQYRFNAGNLVITGNVTGGRAFRGFSPIRDSSSLFMSLPTSRLGHFQRDSIGLGDVMAGRSQAVASPFYLPSSTATGAGGFGGGFSPTMPGRRQTAFVVPRVDLFTGKSLSLSAGLNPGSFKPTAETLDPRFLPRQQVITSPYGRDVGTFQSLPAPLPTDANVLSSRRLADSPVFGLPDYQSDPPGRRWGNRAGAQAGRTRSRASLLDRLYDTDTAGSPFEFAPTLFNEAERRDLLTDRSTRTPGEGAMSSARLLEPPSSSGRSTQPLTTPIGGEPAQGVAANTEGLRPAPYDPSEFIPAGRSVYQDFQRAVQWTKTHSDSLEPGPEGETEDAAEGVSDGEEAPAGGFDVSVSYVLQILNQSPKSMAGTLETDLNVRIRKAEALMRQGEFYNAAAQYAIAASLEPGDPLLRLGQGHAYLAAGDYLSAVYFLTQGLERFPEVARFRLDLYDFVSDPNVLDIRRADLETKLEKQDDYRLRFLLGYAEYYGGLKKFGLPQLRRAAEDAPADSVIARFPRMLEDVSPPSTVPQEHGLAP